MEFYSSNNGIIGNFINPQLTGSSVDVGLTSMGYFPMDNYDYVNLLFTGANRGNNGTVWNEPKSPDNLSFRSSVSLPTGSFTGSGVVMTFPFNLWYSDTAYHSNENQESWTYTGYSATGLCTLLVSANGGVPVGNFISTNYANGTGMVSGIYHYIYDDSWVTAVPAYSDVPGHVETASSASHVELQDIFSGIKNAYSYDGFTPLKGLP